MWVHCLAPQHLHTNVDLKDQLYSNMSHMEMFQGLLLYKQQTSNDL